MITLTIVEEKKVKGGPMRLTRTIESFKDLNKASKRIKPIVQEMEKAESMHRKPKIFIDGVSYDTEHEMKFLRSLRAYKFENRSDGIYGY